MFFHLPSHIEQAGEPDEAEGAQILGGHHPEQTVPGDLRREIRLNGLI